mmetsp:Transcript_1393/g.3865  ORF Transcript_1393/g.3865 Transcript_1393/m.3865 type:complete len:96 (+) Transcript_1393:595-882(+)
MKRVNGASTELHGDMLHTEQHGPDQNRTEDSRDTNPTLCNAHRIPSMCLCFSSPDRTHSSFIHSTNDRSAQRYKQTASIKQDRDREHLAWPGREK